MFILEILKSRCNLHFGGIRVRLLQELRSFRMRPGWWSFAVKLMTPKKKLSTQQELRFVGQALNSFVWWNVFWSRRLKDSEEFSVSESPQRTCRLSKRFIGWVRGIKWGFWIKDYPRILGQGWKILRIISS